MLTPHAILGILALDDEALRKRQVFSCLELHSVNQAWTKRSDSFPSLVTAACGDGRAGLTTGSSERPREKWTVLPNSGLLVFPDSGSYYSRMNKEDSK